MEADFNKVNALHLLKKHNHDKVVSRLGHILIIIITFSLFIGNYSMKKPAFLSTISNKYSGFIRDKAINRARTRIIVAGNDPRDFTPEDLEVVVKEEEDKIKQSVKEKGLLAVLAALGLNFFG